MLTIATWWWGTKYDVSYVHKVAAGLNRHLRQPYRFVCVTDHGGIEGIETWPIVDLDLLKIPGCFARLRMFDPQWQAELKIQERLVCIDLDCVITGSLDLLFNEIEPFMIFQGANTSNPNPYNGSLFMLRPGTHSDVWTTFSLEAASAIPHHEFPDDQGWFWHKIPHASGWRVGRHTGVWAFRKRAWQGDNLPPGARIVFFPGRRDPAQFKHLPWIERHWRA